MNFQLDGIATAKTRDELAKWYQSRIVKNSWLGKFLRIFFGAPLTNPKIFEALQGCPDYQVAAVDAWRRAMWHTGGLQRRTREAIAVAVSIANQCLY